MIEGTKIGNASVMIVIDLSAEDILTFFGRPLSEVSDREILEIIHMHPSMLTDAPVVINREE